MRLIIDAGIGRAKDSEGFRYQPVISIIRLAAVVQREVGVAARRGASEEVHMESEAAG